MDIADNVVLDFENGSIFRDKLYFTDINNNELYVYDLEKKICKFQKEFSADSEESRLFGKIIPMEQSIILIPFVANSIYEVILKTKQVVKYELRTPRIQYEGYSNTGFLNVFPYDAKLYLVGNYPAIVEFDLATKKIEYWDEWVEEITLGFSKGDVDNALFRKAIMIHHKIYAPMCKENAIVVFDILDHTSAKLKLGDACFGYSAICYDGENFWLSPRADGPLVRWNELKHVTEEFREFPPDIERGCGSFNDCVFWGEKIWLLPGNTDQLISVDITSGAMTVEKSDFGYASSVKYDSANQIIFYSCRCHYMLVLDTEGKAVDSRHVFAPKEREYQHRRKKIKKQLETKAILQEKNIFDLKVWLECETEYTRNEKEKNHGQIIFNFIRKYQGDA